MPPVLRTLLGVSIFLVLGLSLGVVDRRAADGARTPGVGSVSGAVVGTARYRVVLTPTAASTTSPGDHVIEGRGRFFRDDAVPTGRYAVSIIAEPDSVQPHLIVFLPIPAGAERLAPNSEAFTRLASAMSDLARVARAGDVAALEPFFDERFRGSSGQTRSEHIARASAAAASTDPQRFEITVEDAFRAEDRWFARLRYTGSYRMRLSEEQQTISSTFLSELRETPTGFRFLTTDVTSLPGLSGIQALPREFRPAPDLATVLVRSGASVAMPHAIVVDAALAAREHDRD